MIKLIKNIIIWIQETILLYELEKSEREIERGEGKKLKSLKDLR